MWNLKQLKTRLRNRDQRDGYQKITMGRYTKKVKGDILNNIVIKLAW